MDFESFISELILSLRSCNKNCIKLLENNTKLIDDLLTENGNPKFIDRLVTEINDAIISNKEKFKLFEKVLKHYSFEYVYSVFKKSDILIEACKNERIEAIKWLLTMDISPYVQDENGMTALMYAVQNKELLFVVDNFCNNFRCCNIEDRNGNNALFYSVYNYFALKKLTEIDINHLNHQHETILLYCCKNDIYEPVKTLLDRPGIDLSIVDNENKNALMYLVEKERNFEINYISATNKGYAFDYKNSLGESILSILIRKMYRKDCHAKEKESYINMANIMTSLVKGNIDFNVEVDEDGNTALMAIIIANDFETFHFVIKNSKNYDLSKKNRNGENATSLFLKATGGEIYEKMTMEHYSFDSKYVDPINKNTALILATINHSSIMEDIIRSYYQSINSVNNYQENALIISAKMNHIDAASILLDKGIQVNHQDITGNTALHYAVESKNIEMIQKLVEYGSDYNILNDENKSAIELAKCSEDENILKAVLGTLSPSDLKNTIYIRPTKTPQINEYSYSLVSNLYIKLEKNDMKENAIASVYSKYIEIKDFSNYNKRGFYVM